MHELAYSVILIRDNIYTIAEMDQGKIVRTFPHCLEFYSAQTANQFYWDFFNE